MNFALPCWAPSSIMCTHLMYVQMDFSWINLHVHLDDSLPNERGSKEGPKGDEKVTTGNACQIKERVWYLWGGEWITIFHSCACKCVHRNLNALDGTHTHTHRCIDMYCRVSWGSLPLIGLGLGRIVPHSWVISSLAITVLPTHQCTYRCTE